MKQLIKRIVSQEFINNFYHLPKAVLANIIYGFPARGEARQRRPARGLKVIGVTGTDGKTTTTNMIYQILKSAGKKVSMVSTINAVIGGKSYDTGFHVTSPDPFMIQRFAKQAKEHGDEYLILEVTSHALDQNRFWGIKFDVGVITNITHEHLDYHKTYQNYLNTKLEFIQDVQYAIINSNLKTNIPRSWDICLNKGIVTFGHNGDLNQKALKLNLKVPGDYNIENALAALGVAFSLKINNTIAKRALEQFSGIAGRMEEIKNNKGIKIIVDFAHTPNALEQALQTLKKQTKGKIIAVFGLAGKRDVEKRGLMGKVAGKLADFIVITAEDPRGELKTINEQILKGVKSAGKTLDEDVFIIDDRLEAIGFATNKLAKKGDTVGIFGKGHEASMNLDGKKEIPWSDKKAVNICLQSDSSGRKKSLTNIF